jgi:hypothetical protein
MVQNIIEKLSLSLSKNILPSLWNLKVHPHGSQKATTGPYPELAQSSSPH